MNTDKKMIIEKNTMDYMALSYGSDWYGLIDEEVDNDAYDAINLYFKDDEEWQEAAASETYWGGQIELEGKTFWIASEFECTMSEGICFMVEVENG